MNFTALTTALNSTNLSFSSADRRRNLSLYANGNGAPQFGLRVQQPYCQGGNAEMSMSSRPDGSTFSAVRQADQQHGAEADRPSRSEFLAAFKANFDF